MDAVASRQLDADFDWQPPMLAGKAMLAGRLTPTLAGRTILAGRAIPISYSMIPRFTVSGRGPELLPTAPRWKRNRIPQIRCPIKCCLASEAWPEVVGSCSAGVSITALELYIHGITSGRETFRLVSNLPVQSGSSGPNNFLGAEFVTAFLNPDVDGEVYMTMPGGAESPEGGSWVYKLRKSLYGLKQAPRLWYEHVDNLLRSLGLLRFEREPNIYISAAGLKPLIHLLYVDGILLFSESAK